MSIGDQKAEGYEEESEHRLTDPDDGRKLTEKESNMSICMYM